MSSIAGFAAAALDSLSPSQVDFIKNLPKAELHAHLNGSIPIATLKDLARDYPVDENQSDIVQSGLDKLHGVVLEQIHDFFSLFPAIYALTSTPEALRRATRAVLETFLDSKQCTYLELRSTPKATDAMSRMEYVRVVVDEVEKYSVDQAALIVSLDRRMDESVIAEVIEVAVTLRKEGRRVVGIDVCGDPLAGDMDVLEKHIRTAKAAGLGVTLHIAETVDNPGPETLRLLSYEPDRLGHATFLDDEAKEVVLQHPNMCIEICLSSNLLCKTVPTLDDHHIRYYLEKNHPVAICTDDILPFRNSMLGDVRSHYIWRDANLGLILREMASASFSQFGISLDGTIGAMFLGIVGASMLYGAENLQTYAYFRRYPRDHVLQKASVSLLWIIETLTLALAIHANYSILVTGWGNPFSLLDVIWSYQLQNVFNVLLIFFLHTLYAIRTYKLGRHFNRYLPYGAILCVVVEYGIGLWAIVSMYSVKQMVDLQSVLTGGPIMNEDLRVSLNTFFITSTCVDFILAFFMCACLYRCHSVFTETNSKIQKLMQYTIASGLATSACSMAMVISFWALPKAFVFAGIELLLPRLYANSYLAMLNIRIVRDKPTSAAATHSPLTSSTPSTNKLIPKVPLTVHVSTNTSIEKEDIETTMNLNEKGSPPISQHSQDSVISHPFHYASDASPETIFLAIKEDIERVGSHSNSTKQKPELEHDVWIL
ncbi:hypothetical protein ONZ45_g7268 [Pleurotus djamor]|nr:hypothetical protein ONZ45_g7268 [Pleurotus djamor]